MKREDLEAIIANLEEVIEALLVERNELMDYIVAKELSNKPVDPEEAWRRSIVGAGAAGGALTINGGTGRTTNWEIK